MMYGSLHSSFRRGRRGLAVLKTSSSRLALIDHRREVRVMPINLVRLGKPPLYRLSPSVAVGGFNITCKCQHYRKV